MVRAVISTLVLALVAAFVVLNWTALAAPMMLSLGVTSVQAPLGLLMLVLLGLLGALFAGWAFSMLAELRRQARDLHTQRDLADRAEASRFTELRDFVGAEFRRLAQEERTALEQSTNTLAASIGELEERLARGRSSLPPDGPRSDNRLPLNR